MTEHQFTVTEFVEPIFDSVFDPSPANASSAKAAPQLMYYPPLLHSPNATLAAWGAAELAAAKTAAVTLIGAVAVERESSAGAKQNDGQTVVAPIGGPAVESEIDPQIQLDAAKQAERERKLAKHAEDVAKREGEIAKREENVARQETKIAAERKAANERQSLAEKKAAEEQRVANEIATAVTKREKKMADRAFNHVNREKNVAKQAREIEGKELKLAAERKASKVQRLAEEKAAGEKAAEELRLAKEKAAEELRLAEAERKKTEQKLTEVIYQLAELNRHNSRAGNATFFRYEHISARAFSTRGSNYLTELFLGGMCGR